LALIERSTILNPNSASAWMASGMAYAYRGDSSVAIDPWSAPRSSTRSIRWRTSTGSVFLRAFAGARYTEASAWVEVRQRIERVELRGALQVIDRHRAVPSIGIGHTLAIQALAEFGLRIVDRSINANPSSDSPAIMARARPAIQRASASSCPFSAASRAEWTPLSMLDSVEELQPRCDRRKWQ